MSAELHDGMTLEQYLALPAESASGLRDMLVSPLLYRWRQEHGRPDADVMRVGRAAHTAVLEPQRYQERYVVWPGRRAGKEWKAFELANASKTILTAPRSAASFAIAAAVYSNPLATELLGARGQAEVTITWRHARTGLPCKARPDWICDLALVEVKTCANPAPAVFAGAAARLGYHVQLAFYAAACRALGLKPKPTKLIAIQNVPPYDVVVYDVPDDVLVIGEEQYEAALDRIASCRGSGVWPGSGAEEVTLRLPSWAVPIWDDQLTSGGEPLFEEAAS